MLWMSCPLDITTTPTLHSLSYLVTLVIAITKVSQIYLVGSMDNVSRN